MRRPRIWPARPSPDRSFIGANAGLQGETSINQKLTRSRRLPDFRNLGVALRIIVTVHALAAMSVGIQSEAPADLGERMLLFAGRLELPLFLSVLVLYVARPQLARLRYPWAQIAVLAIAGLATLLAETLAGTPPYRLAGAVLWALCSALLCLAYFDYREQRLSPSLAEARLQALTVRMRPHFLFNSLNAVLGVIRSDPRRAENALEEMSDVFRAVMKENRELIPIATELELCERYLGLERLRLGERLQLRFELDQIPADALIPPLMLQPLIENAVYHGIEPRQSPGEIRVVGELRGKDILIEVSNPLPAGGSTHAGNHMAMENIRERLMLFYDLEASLSVEREGESYRVRIRLPLRRRAS